MNFFQGFSCKFEGLPAEVQKQFEDIIQRLHGTICKEADYILTDQSYHSNLENKDNRDFYSIHYILDSIKAKQPLDIKKYRFHSIEQSDIPCCSTAKYILRTSSCKRYYNDHIRCSVCDHDHNNTNSINISKVNNISINIDEAEVLNKQQHNDIQEVSSNKSNSITRWKINKVPSTYSTEEKHKDTNQCSEAEVNDSAKRMRKDLESNIEFKGTQQNSEDLTDKTKSSVIKKFNENLRNKKYLQETVNIDDSHESIRRKTRTENPREITENSQTKDKMSESSGELQFSSDEDDEEINEEIQKDWWCSLPPVNMQETNVGELRRRDGDRRRGQTYRLSEQRLMIAFLVKNKKICYGPSRKPWKEMHEKGYLRHRSVESLNNHFRKSILPRIKTFGLPNDILQEFLLLKD